jgi:F0F1-type ATP synthase membrane subunit b/b'
MNGVFAAIPPVATVLLWALVAFAILVAIRAVIVTVKAMKGLAATVSEASGRLEEATTVLKEEKALVEERMERLAGSKESEDR